MAPARGDIYYIEIAKGEAIGHELEGGHWWVVISATELNAQLGLFAAVPLTSVINKNTGKPKDESDFRYFRIRILNSAKKRDPGRTDKIFDAHSIAMPEQMRTFSIQRIVNQPRSGVMDDTALGLGAIEAGILFMLRAAISRQPVSPPTTTAQVSVKRTLPVEPPKPVPGKPHK